MEYREIINLINVINISPIGDNEKTKATNCVLELYNEAQNKFTQQDKSLIEPQGDDQMKINIDGISIGKKPRADGLYQGYVKLFGKRDYYYAPTPEEVYFKIQQALRTRYTYNTEKQVIKVRKPKTTGAPLFKDYVEKWVKVYKEPNLKPTSLHSLVGTLKKPLEEFGDRPIDKISSDDVQSLLIGITATRSRDLCKGSLNQIFKKAVAQGYIEKNPCDSVELQRHKKVHKKALTREEQETFIEAAKETSHYLLFRFLLATGLRIGEALALTKDDIDFERGAVTVSKNVVYIGNKRIEQPTPKSEAGNRTIPFPKEFSDEFKEVTTFELFPCSYNAVKKSMDRIAKKTGLNVTLHILRHTYATRLEEAGISPKLKQYLLGHASLEMTQNTYTDIQADYVYTLSDKIRQAV